MEKGLICAVVRPGADYAGVIAVAEPIGGGRTRQKQIRGSVEREEDQGAAHGGEVLSEARVLLFEVLRAEGSFLISAEPRWTSVRRSNASMIGSRESVYSDGGRI